jgi:hypothetical protein
MNRLIRQAAGRAVPVPERPVERVGNVGVGSGGGAARRPDAGAAAIFNEWARSAWQANRLNRLGLGDLSN